MRGRWGDGCIPSSTADIIHLGFNILPRNDTWGHAFPLATIVSLALSGGRRNKGAMLYQNRHGIYDRSDIFCMILWLKTGSFKLSLFGFHRCHVSCRHHVILHVRGDTVVMIFIEMTKRGSPPQLPWNRVMNYLPPEPGRPQSRCPDWNKDPSVLGMKPFSVMYLLEDPGGWMIHCCLPLGLAVI